MLNSECWERAGFLILFARAIRKQAYSKATCICECEMQVLSSQKQITKCESTAFSGTRFPFDRYAGFHYSGFTDYSGAAEPPVRKNGSHHSRPREPPIYSSFVWSNSACCCRAGFHKPVRASRLPTSSLEAHAML